MDGVEIDAYRLYSNFYSRFEVAKYYIKDLKNAKYIVSNLLDINKKYDYIIWLLPFVSYEPLKYWGLPKRFFCPEKMLNHAFSLLNDGGQMLIINQGKKEALIQKELLEKLNLNYTFLGKIENKFYQFKNDRFGYLISKF
ncbi:MAG: hypothetical protein IJB79_07785 [Candidatus Gastranaerophilales bacterium]|nr:hypothetical protein [Candidatus Gastranaerophilales bacterium]